MIDLNQLLTPALLSIAIVFAIAALMILRRLTTLMKRSNSKIAAKISTTAERATERIESAKPKETHEIASVGNDHKLGSERIATPFSIDVEPRPEEYSWIYGLGSRRRGLWKRREEGEPK